MDRLTPLMERPGEWAMVHRASTRAATAASALRNREYHYPPGKWEFRSSHRELFARYIGPE
jgi:hypothetical protein